MDSKAQLVEEMARLVDATSSKPWRRFNPNRRISKNSGIFHPSDRRLLPLTDALGNLALGGRAGLRAPQSLRGHGFTWEFAGHTRVWDFSTARAVEVVGFLVSKGVDARSLSAAGYSEFDPIDTNETREGRSRNRRTELTLQPNIGEMVAVPGSP